MLQRLGVTPPQSPVVACCVDWPEQRHHIGGPLGRALLDRFLERGWLDHTPRSRALRLTDEGAHGLRSELGAVPPEFSATSA